MKTIRSRKNCSSFHDFIRSEARWWHPRILQRRDDAERRAGTAAWRCTVGLSPGRRDGVLKPPTRGRDLISLIPAGLWGSDPSGLTLQLRSKLLPSEAGATHQLIKVSVYQCFQLIKYGPITVTAAITLPKQLLLCTTVIYTAVLLHLLLLPRLICQIILIKLIIIDLTVGPLQNGGP